MFDIYLRLFTSIMRRKLRFNALFCIIVFCCACKQQKSKDIELYVQSCTPDVLSFGFNTNDYFLHIDTIQPNEFLADILLRHGISYQSIDHIAKNATEVYDVRNLRVKKPYALVSTDSCAKPEYFVYQPNVYRYVVYALQDSFRTKIIEKPIDIRIKSASGTIESSLWNAMIDNNLPYSLIVKLEDIFAWSIDFHHILKGDKFKLIYEQEYIDEKPVGIGRIHAAYFKNYSNEYFAIYFENSKHHGYFDAQGRSMKKAFLKSPVRYSRISSGYNRRRRHPILKRVRPHLGTDYAAPYGTPIMAVADGVVTKVSRTRNNGNFVKIKHDDTYSTQYLHMQRFAKDIKPGVHVRQEQTIGYVGSTGLATGPHVCFRFWKNGKQVDHRKEQLPPPEPMPKEDLPTFFALRDSIIARLDSIPITTTTPRGQSIAPMQEATPSTN